MNHNLSKAEIGSVSHRRPVFISSLYRSSSTFVTALLSCHPKYFAMSSAVKYLRFGFAKYCPILEERNIDKLIDETYCRVNTRWNIQFEVGLAKEIGISNGGGYAGFYDGIMTAIMFRYAERKIEWTEKIAVMWSGIPAFLNMFPNGKVLHVHRDPRSVMASYKNMTNEPGYAYLDTIFNYISSIQHLKNYKEKFGKNRIMEVKSEDMAFDPESELRKICSFLEIDFEKKCLTQRSLRWFWENLGRQTPHSEVKLLVFQNRMKNGESFLSQMRFCYWKLLRNRTSPNSVTKV